MAAREAAAAASAVAIFLPGVGVVVVAAEFPEAEVVAGGELDAPQPLWALPEIEVRHDEPNRSTVVQLERLALPTCGTAQPSSWTPGSILTPCARRFAGNYARAL